MRERRLRRERTSRQPWYLLTGFLLGLAAGIAFSVWFWPVPYDFARPSDLTGDSRDIYRLAIARAYFASGDSGRAYPRLDLLKDEQPESILAAHAQRVLAAGQEKDSNALALLAQKMNPEERIKSTPVSEYQGSIEPTLPPETTNTPSGILSELPTAEATAETDQDGTPVPTIAPLNIPSAEIPRSTPTMFPTISAPYILKEKAVDCGRNPRPGLLQIWVENASGLAMPGVRIQINWKDGEETFYTGLKPDMNNGYADYEMTPGVIYSLRVGESGETVTGLSAADCASEGYPERVGGMVLRFTER